MNNAKNIKLIAALEPSTTGMLNKPVYSTRKHWVHPLNEKKNI